MSIGKESRGAACFSNVVLLNGFPYHIASPISDTGHKQHMLVKKTHVFLTANSRFTDCRACEMISR
jgi:hypothetical protein